MTVTTIVCLYKLTIVAKPCWWLCTWLCLYQFS